MAEPQALFESFVGGVVLALEAAAALIILVAGARALLHWGLRTLRPTDGHSAHRPLRHEFGRSLLLALDFTIGSDMLKVALAPAFDGALLAGLVVLVRIALTLVLEYELRQEKKDAPEGTPAEEATGHPATPTRGRRSF